MANRLNALFYTFLVIFAATAVVTLLGVTGVFSIDSTQMNVLLGAFLVELAGAVIAIFKGAPFFGEKRDMVQTVSDAVEVIDEMFPQIEALIAGNTQAEVNRQYGVIMRRQGRDLVAYQRLQVISGSTLEALPDEQKEEMKFHEQQMLELRSKWTSLYEKRNKVHSDTQRAKIDNELRLLGTEIKKEFKVVLEFLIKQGAILEDHYRHVRQIVDSL